MTVLYVTEREACLKIKHQQFQVYHNSELQLSIPVNRISHIVLFGSCRLTHGAMSLALRRQIPVMFLSYQGRYFGRLQGKIAEIDYLQQQVKNSLNPEFRLRQAKSIVAGKILNERTWLQRWYRSNKLPKPQLAETIEKLALWREKVKEVESIEVLLGYEGQASRLYFQALGSFLLEPFTLTKRTRRPPTDPVNSLLSLGYTLLFQQIHTLIQAVGLHPHFGNLHTPRPNHPALVSDLMEEFRTPIVDSLVTYLVNSQIFHLEDFTSPDERGGVYLQPKALKTYLHHWQEKLHNQVTHPYTGVKVTNLRCFELQVWEYIACVIGESEVYRPMLWKK
ncbi:MAG: CRISPR-associated endonuclease Cas1 [Oscillatoria sp. PMC 1068.18]|nr:CRISPR-associated endonuclease Cas1 [Oscillatoria sp. PMC 1076.18]MEC4987130.1 CRISPR-associated endonuclease Cas1 [Oscillatoria sp. PMC 1068.18]